MSDIETTWTPELPPVEAAVPRHKWMVIPKDSIVLISYIRADNDVVVQARTKRHWGNSVELENGWRIYYTEIRHLWVLKIGREFSEGLVRQIAMDLWKFSSSSATSYNELAQAGKERIEDIAYRALMETKHGPNSPEGPCEYVTSEYGAIVRVAMAIYSNTTGVARPAWHRLTGQEQERFIQIARDAMSRARP